MNKQKKKKHLINTFKKYIYKFSQQQSEKGIIC